MLQQSPGQLNELAQEARIVENEHRRPKRRQALVDDQSEQHRQWMVAGLKKGMKLLFRSMAKSEVVIIRPFRDAPVTERPLDRRNQWAAMWGEHEQPAEVGEDIKALGAAGKHARDQGNPKNIKGFSKPVKKKLSHLWPFR